MNTTLRRLMRAGVVAVSATGLVTLASLPAAAHVTVSPSVTAAGSYTVLTFSVPHGCDGAGTTKVAIQVPEQIVAVTPTINQGWAVEKLSLKLPETPDETMARPVVLAAALGSGRITARLTPGAVGINSLELSVLDSAGRPAEPVDQPTVTVTQPEFDIGPLDRPVAVVAPGRYEAVADFPLAGDWVITVSVRTSKYENPIVEIPVEIR